MVSKSPLAVIQRLKRAKNTEERRKILLMLTKKERQALFGEEYFDHGAKSGISHYENRTAHPERVVDIDYSIAYACVRKVNAQTVLEVGCAAGEFVKALRKFGIETYGIDVSSYILSQAPHSGIFLKNIDVETERLPFSNGSFDMIVAIETMEHLVNIAYTLENFRRVLKDGGYIFLTCPRPNHPGAFTDVTHVNIWDRDAWVNAFSNAGFKPFPLNVNYHQILEAHVDLLAVASSRSISCVKDAIIGSLVGVSLGKIGLYAYLLARRKLRKALQLKMNLHHVFLFKREP